MKQSSLKRDLWLDRLLLALSLLGIGIFAYLLNDHSILFRSKQKSERQKIGSVEQSQYDVRRRESNEYVWIPLGDLESVYLGDSIFTGPKSSVSIQLQSGVKLWIDPNSLVVLDQSENLIKLDLKFGNLRGQMSAQSPAPLKLNINDKDLNLEGPSVEFILEKQKPSNAKIKVTQGQAKLTESKSKKQISLSKKQLITLAREVASIGEINTTEEEPVFVRVNEWAMNKNYWNTSTQKIKFLWQTEGPVDHYRLIVSRKSDLREPLINEKLKVNGYEWLPPFDEGKIFWKVIAYTDAPEKKSIQSELIQWNMSLLIAPEWKKDSVDPLAFSLWQWNKARDSEGVTSPTVKKVEKILENPIPTPRLEWKNHNLSSLFRIELSQDPIFSDKIANGQLTHDPLNVEKLGKATAANEKLVFEVSSDVAKVSQDGNSSNEFRWNLPQLSIGKYYARIRSEYRGRPASPWSHTLIFEIVDGDPDGLIEPFLLTQDTEGVVGGEPLMLRWEKQDKTRDYLVEVSPSKDFKSVLASSMVHETNFMVKQDLFHQTEGDYFFRVYPLARNGRKGPVSKSIVWHLQAPPPIVLSPPQVLTNNKEESIENGKDSTLRINWNPVQYATKYKVQISNSVQFDNIHQEQILERNEWDLSVKTAGLYFIRVAGIANKNSLNQSLNPPVVGPWSSFVTWKVKLEAPRLVPQDPLLITLDSAKAPIPPGKFAIQWKAFSEIPRFQLEMSDSSNFSSLKMKKVVYDRSYNLTLAEPGTYYLRVKGVSESGEDLTTYSPLEKIKFVVKKPVSAPQLLLPSDKVSYILSKMQQPQVWLEWESDKLLNQFQIEVAKDPNFNQIIYTQMPRSNRFQLDQKVLKGKIYWRVKGLNTDQGLESPWSVPRSLSVVELKEED